jgi:hypothetical protein
MGMNIKVFLALATILMTAYCAPSKTADQQVSLMLAAFTENDVQVSVQLDGAQPGEYLLSATFTPPDGYHLYSKDIPLTGVGGLGRPTLLEMTAHSQMKTLGGLIESVKAQEPDFEPKDLLVYPLGAVTLSLLVQLPPGADWVDDEIKVSYMSCNDNGCKAPVIGKLVPVLIPGAEVFADQ